MARDLTDLKNRRVTLGYTFVELVMVISLLGVLAALVLPVIDKPFQIKHRSDGYHRASASAIVVMTWLERDLERHYDEIIVKDAVLELTAEDRKVYYQWNESSEQLIRGIVDNRDIERGFSVVEDVLERSISGIQFEKTGDMLSVYLSFDVLDGEGVGFWRQWGISVR